MTEAEADVSHLEGIPVTIIQGGEKYSDAKLIGIDLYVDQAGDAHVVTAKEEKGKILNEKVSPVPDEMRDNPDSCRLILLKDQDQKIVFIPDVDRMRNYSKALARDNSRLVIADNADMDEGSAATQIRQALGM